MSASCRPTVPGVPPAGAGLRPRVLWLSALTAAGLVIVLGLPPVAQDPSYHQFADQRGGWGVPHFLNVISNAAIFLVGCLGLCLLWRRRQDAAGRWPYLALFTGVVLTGLGSAYYHWAPDDARLVWDRLPMTIVFMAFFSAVMAERVDGRAGPRVLVPLLLAGAASVFYWRATGDLRPYIFVQYFPLLLLPLVLWLLPARRPGGLAVTAVLGWYGAAKLLEWMDGPVFALGGLVSGHTLKHLAAAAGALAVWQTLRRPAGPMTNEK